MSRGLALVARQSGDPAGDVLLALARALAPLLRELLREELRGEERVDVVRFAGGPKRGVMSACRKGAIQGAAKVARRWVAPKASVEAWLRGLRPRLVADDREEDDLEDLRRSLSRPEPRRNRRAG